MEYDEGKLFVTAEALRDLSHQLAHHVWQSGFRPTHLVALWRGGAPIALHMDEYFALLGLKVDCTDVRTSSYVNQQQHRDVRVHGEHYLVETLRAEHRVLLVDDILESGRSMAALLRVLREKLGERAPEFRIATLLTKSEKHERGNPSADWSVRDVAEDQWVVFPHELEALKLAQLKRQMSTQALQHLAHDMGVAGLDLDSPAVMHQLGDGRGLAWELAHADWTERADALSKEPLMTSEEEHVAELREKQPHLFNLSFV